MNPRHPMDAAATLVAVGGRNQNQRTSANVEALWHEFHEALFRFFRKRVNDDAVAEDLLMDAFLRIQKGIGSVASDASIRGWVYRIARNLVVDHYRARKPHSNLAGADDEHAAPEPEPSNAEAVAFGSCVMSMIDHLPPKYQGAVRLVELEGLPQREVADRLGLSTSGAKSRVQRGREQLKSLVSKCCRVEMDRRGNVMDHDCAGPCC